MKNIHKINQHIYITSDDEEIKEGVDQWYLDKVLNEPYNSGGAQYSSKQDIIILTTDFKLIKDGVQAIDDEFLEWFVKNPSCDEVEVVKGFADGTSYGYNFLEYKITIPKEEEPLYDYGWCKCNVVLPKEETTLKLPSFPYEYDPLINKNQETLEEAAEIYTNNGMIKAGFIKGAKWQINKQDNFAIGFAEWSVARALGCDKFTINQYELNIYKKYIDTLNGN